MQIILRAEQSRAEQSRAEQSRAEQSRERILWIDLLRGIGIILVVVGHARPPFSKLIYGFHMPLFFIITGYLFGRNKSLSATPSQFIFKNVRRYLLPYVILCFINLMIETGLFISGVYREARSFNLAKYVYGILYSIGSVEYMPNCTPLWFLTCLFCATIIFFWIHKIRNRSFGVIVVVLCAFISSLLSYIGTVNLPWNIDVALMAVLFLEAGFIICKSSLLENLENKPSVQRFLVVTIIFALGIAAIVMNPESVDFDGNTYGNVIMMIIGALGITVPLMHITIFLEGTGFIQSKIVSYIVFLGRHTIFIIGFDYFTGSISHIALEKIGLYSWATCSIMKLVLLSIGVVVWNAIIHKVPNKEIRSIISF